MKFAKFSILVVTTIATMNVAWSEEKYSVTFGAGVPFSGLGVGLAMYSNSDHSFAALGCFGWRGGDFENSRDCGFSVGYFTNRLFSNKKLSIGPVVSFSDSNESTVSASSHR